MNNLHNFFWLMKQVWSGITYSGPISLTMASVAIIALALNNPFVYRNYTHKHLLLLTPFFLTFLLLLIGAIFAHNDSQSSAPEWPATLLTFIALVHIPLAAFLIWKMKGFRWATVALCPIQIWCSYWALFVASMSVTGDWL